MAEEFEQTQLPHVIPVRPHRRDLEPSQLRLLIGRFHEFFPLKTHLFMHTESAAEESEVVKDALQRTLEYFLYTPEETWRRIKEDRPWDGIRYEKVGEICELLHHERSYLAKSSINGQKPEADGNSSIIENDCMNARMKALRQLEGDMMGDRESATFEKMHKKAFTVNLPHYSTLCAKEECGNNGAFDNWLLYGDNYTETFTSMEDLEQLGRTLIEETAFLQFWSVVFHSCKDLHHNRFTSYAECEQHPEWIALGFTLILGAVLEVQGEVAQDADEAWLASRAVVLAITKRLERYET